MPPSVRGFISFHVPRSRNISQYPKGIISHLPSGKYFTKIFCLLLSAASDGHCRRILPFRGAWAATQGRPYGFPAVFRQPCRGRPAWRPVSRPFDYASSSIALKKAKSASVGRFGSIAKDPFLVFDDQVVRNVTGFSHKRLPLLCAVHVSFKVTAI